MPVIRMPRQPRVMPGYKAPLWPSSRYILLGRVDVKERQRCHHLVKDVHNQQKARSGNKGGGRVCSHRKRKEMWLNVLKWVKLSADSGIIEA